MLPVKSPLSAAADRLLTIRQAAEQLQISERTVRRLIGTGALPAVKIGGRLVRIRARDLRIVERPL